MSVIAENLEFCNRTVGGVQKIWLANYYTETLPSGLYKITEKGFQYELDENQVVLFAFGDPAVWYVYEFDRDSAAYSESATPIQTDEGIAYTQTLTFSASYFNGEKRRILDTLIRTRVAAVVKDFNGFYWLMGADNGLRMGSLETESGTRTEAGTSNKITLRGFEAKKMYLCDRTVVEP